MKDLEQEYKKQVQEEMPDLWNRIEPNLAPKKKKPWIRRYAPLTSVAAAALVLLAVVGALAVMDRKALAMVDYGLLCTFVCFFIFSGNMSRLAPVRDFFSGLLQWNTLLTAVLSCQVISNVPAAILLSQFTDDYPALLVGVNIGGDAGGVAGQPDHLPGVYEARQGTDRTVPGAVLRRQLRLFGRAAGSHDVFDAIDRAPGLHGGKEADGSCSAICKSALTP